MKRFSVAIMAFIITIISSISAEAQTMSVNGSVRSSADNTPVVAATVLVKSSGTGTKTDGNGAFSIKASKGDMLTISAVGYISAQIKVSGSALSVLLRTSEGVMQEVVVTAMDIKRNPRELGYSVQKVTGKEIAETQRENFLNGLQGRVAGLTINQTNGQAGSSSSIVLRGFNSMALDNQPLFVVDGIIADNQTVNETSNQGVALGLASDRPNRNNDYTNRIADLNPNDIESITVLKGPEATALYGSQASSGAIVITTKKGNNSGKLGLNYDNSFRWQKETRFPKVSDRYSAGSNGVASNLFSYFGPEYLPGTQKFDNVHNFFKTGFAETHNLSAEFGKKNVTFRASGSIFDQSGVIPENKYRKINLRISNTTKIGKFLDITPAISFINSKNDKPLRGAGGYLLNLLIWPVENDVRNYLDSSGGKKGVFSAITPNAEFDNPFFNVKYNRSQDNTNRYLMTLGVNINPFSWLTIAGRFGYDTYKQNGYTFYHPESFYLTKGM